MPDYYYIFKPILLLSEIMAALVGLFHLSRLNNCKWKFLVYYLVIIALQETFWHIDLGFSHTTKQMYYAYFGIPLQYIFLYWLYAIQSLGNKKIFVICLTLYLFTYIPIELFFKKLWVVYSLNPTIGTIFLILLVILEFLKQIKEDSILYFYRNNMFYINLGVILFYIGTYPFFCFYSLLRKNYLSIWHMYFAYFLVANILMYSLFALSFIWGRHHSK